MGRLDEALWQDHQELRSEVEALTEVLKVEALPEDRREVLWSVLQALGPHLERHLHREESLLASFQRILGKRTPTVDLLKDEYRELRIVLKQLTELVVRPETSNWSNIVQTTRLLVDLLEDHERKEEQLLVEVLESEGGA